MKFTHKPCPRWNSVTTIQEEEYVSAKLSELVLHPNLKQRDGKDLMESIKQQGVYDALLCRRLPDGRVEVIAGSRRWDACKRLGLKEVPAHIRALSDTEARIAALSENLNRQDLLPVEEALLMKALVDEGLTRKEVGDACGRGEDTVTDRLKLLQLPEDIQRRVNSGLIPVQVAEKGLSLLANRPEELKELQRHIEQQVKWGAPLGVDDVVRDAKRKLKDAEEQETILKALKEASNPNCPKCGEQGASLVTGKKLPWVRCKNYHEFNIDTGKMAKGYETIAGEKRRARAKLPSKVIQSELTVGEIRTALMAWAKKQENVLGITVPGARIYMGGEVGDADRDMKTIDVEIWPTRGRAAFDETRFKVEPHKYETGEVTKVELSGYFNTAGEIERGLKKVQEFLDEVLATRKRKK